MHSLEQQIIAKDLMIDKVKEKTNKQNQQLFETIELLVKQKENLILSLEEEIIAKDLMIETLKMRVQLTDKQIQEFNQTIHLFKTETKLLENELNSAKDKVFYFHFNCFFN
jgi:hypothetical protein